MKEKMKECGRYALLLVLSCAGTFLALCEVEIGDVAGLLLFAGSKAAGAALLAAAFLLLTGWEGTGKTPWLDEYLKREDPLP